MTVRKFLLIELFVIGVLVASYLFFMSSTVVDAITRDGALSDAREMASELTDLERQYLDATRGMKRVLAFDHGLSAVEQIYFIERDSSDKLLSYLGEER